MNTVKINNKLTAQVILFTEVMQAYQGIKQTSNSYTYHRANGAEVLDIDFRLKVNDDGLSVSINKSYNKATVSGGRYTEDTQVEVDINALEIWLEDNAIYSKQAHNIADKLYDTILGITSWNIAENKVYTELYKEYEKSSCDTEIAVKILLDKLSGLVNRYYVQKIWLDIKKNEQRIGELF